MLPQAEDRFASREGRFQPHQRRLRAAAQRSPQKLHAHVRAAVWPYRGCPFPAHFVACDTLRRACPTDRFPYSVAEFGGIRIITKHLAPPSPYTPRIAASTSPALGRNSPLYAPPPPPSRARSPPVSLNLFLRFDATPPRTHSPAPFLSQTQSRRSPRPLKHDPIRQRAALPPAPKHCALRIPARADVSAFSLGKLRLIAAPRAVASLVG